MRLNAPTIPPVPPRGRTLLDEIAAVRQTVEEHLAGLFPDGAGASLVELAMGEAVRGKGKRLRPLLAILGARDLGWTGPATDVGVALELVHTASLVLDDLPCMDDSDTRRGKPAIHRAFGEDVAVLASIALLARAYALAAGAPGLSAEQRIEVVAILSEATGPLGLVGGQLDDLRGGALCPARAQAVNDRKTAALFIAATRIACVLARSSEDCRARFNTFGQRLGQAFQILDDLLDMSGDPAAMGKPKGQDAGKHTLARILGPADTEAHLRHHVAAAQAALDALPGGGARVSCLLQSVFSNAAFRPAPAVACSAESSPC